MKKFITTAFVASAAFSATPAFAEIQSGARAEALIGYDNVSVDLSDLGFEDGDKGGFAYGVGLGYDFAVSEKAAIGIDVEYSDSSTKVEVEVAPEFARVSTGRDLYVGARATFAVSDSVNLYAKAGYTNARIKAFYDDGIDTFSESANGDGIRGGVGAQFSVGQAYLLAEYRYSNYEGGFSRNQGMVGIGVRF